MHYFKPRGKALLLTGGIGDLFVLESHFTIVKASLETIYWATRARPLVQPLFERIYPHLEHVNVVDEEGIWDRFWAFISLDDVCSRLPVFDRSKRASHVQEQLQGVTDWSISILFPLLSQIPFQGSSFLKQELASIAHFDLPTSYAVVQPYTPMNREAHRRVRDYRPRDWDKARTWLKDRQLTGVVLNVGDDPIPDDFMDLSNQTSLAEAIEILKAAGGYCGVDSCLSVLAAQLFPGDRLSVMWRNTQYWDNRFVYLKPHKEFSFLYLG